MRVQHAYTHTVFGGGGITPALAGTTNSTTATSSRSRDHPRACGYNTPLSENAESATGSPPRLRVQLV